MAGYSKIDLLRKTVYRGEVVGEWLTNEKSDYTSANDCNNRRSFGWGILVKDRPAYADGVRAVASSELEVRSTNNSYKSVVVPNGSTLNWTLVDGVKVFHLVAEPVKREFAPGLMVDCWGYNGESPGPVIEVVEGDSVRIYVTNRLSEPTTVHWHGILLPNGMDGVSGLNQEPIGPGETFKYEFILRQSGTFMYHPHFDEMTQMGMGMMGMFVVHPNQDTGPQVDRDFSIMLSEWSIRPGTSRPDTTEMTGFNILTMNSKAFPGTAPLVVKRGEPRSHSPGKPKRDGSPPNSSTRLQLSHHRDGWWENS